MSVEALRDLRRELQDGRGVRIYGQVDDNGFVGHAGTLAENAECFVICILRTIYALMPVKNFATDR
ncbi:hypothetical protein [Mesorhizobium captivum]|uniref:hypothetical protein n=1 Tax=Mesorhizobium captivum TaxID=3072319 RepID=UPI002A24413E|nr:hypothetical protein [Mesorhizobium sp. VK3C]MDX8449452.1 hypothetical protein [Mesorhizobium sp. VK3C]